jgi:hypothetical protein
LATHLGIFIFVCFPEKFSSAEPSEEKEASPLPKPGAYSYNLDDLDNVDPFASKKSIMNSPGPADSEPPPPKGAYSMNLDDLESIDPFSSKKTLMNSPSDPIRKDESNTL